MLRSFPPVARSCKRSPYHYTADCDDVVRLTREWSWWLTEGKAAFLRTMSTQDDQHKSLLKQHEGRKKDHQRAVQEASLFLFCPCSLALPCMALYGLSLHRLVSPCIALPCIAFYCLALYRLLLPCIAFYRLALYRLSSPCFVSPFIAFFLLV